MTPTAKIAKSTAMFIVPMSLSTALFHAAETSEILM
jgi:hypothetical protein